jgi:hypothetical protein
VYGFNELAFGDRKFTMSGKDVNKFTISNKDLNSKLTFKATAFEAGSDNTYSVNNAPSSSGFLVTVTVMVFSVVCV